MNISCDRICRRPACPWVPPEQLLLKVTIIWVFFQWKTVFSSWKNWEIAFPWKTHGAVSEAELSAPQPLRTDLTSNNRHTILTCGWQVVLSDFLYLRIQHGLVWIRPCLGKTSGKEKKCSLIHFRFHKTINYQCTKQNTQELLLSWKPITELVLLASEGNLLDLTDIILDKAFLSLRQS